MARQYCLHKIVITTNITVLQRKKKHSLSFASTMERTTAAYPEYGVFETNLAMNGLHVPVGDGYMRTALRTVLDDTHIHSLTNIYSFISSTGK